MNLSFRQRSQNIRLLVLTQTEKKVCWAQKDGSIFMLYRQKVSFYHGQFWILRKWYVQDKQEMEVKGKRKKDLLQKVTIFEKY